ncbi:S66 family peptidase [Alicyclobacillus fodiniaquatilis]|uniref:S66 peptidase family protein n=1 Tax=Alicyclobacillus fodiniaquatilis TaxID=1661150 RepID=A0ABW4JP08_9BACL
MIKYPRLADGATIGVTAPSSGVPKEWHHRLELACDQMKRRGFEVICGETVWKQRKAKSSSAKERADEFNQMMQSNEIDLIIPPWGGELLIEMLEYVDFNQINEKWILGYSDISLLLLAITLKTGIATAHGTNLIDLGKAELDATTAMWQPVLSTEASETVLQRSSSQFQKEWQDTNDSSSVYHLTEETHWQTISNHDVQVQGRLLGGCIDVIRHLIGTPFGDVKGFREQMLNEEPVLWYLENCELSTADLRRSLVQMRLAGWFDHCSGILFGRSAANHPVDDYTIEDVYTELAAELQMPIIYDIDCGHVPPQITFINGAYAKVEVKEGKGTMWQHFKP